MNALTDIPIPQEKLGYTVSWEDKDLSNILGDMTVYAVEQANEYTVTYHLNYDKATMETTSLSVIYGEDFALEKPKATADAEYLFVQWIDKATGEEVKDGKYLYPQDVTVEGVWEPCHTVTFVQDGYDPVIRKVGVGKALTDIPTPQEKIGHTAVWEDKDLSNVLNDLTVYAVATPNDYKITYQLNYNYATMEKTEDVITYGEEFTLEKPVVDESKEYRFVKWIDVETGEEVKSGTYLYPKDITVKCVWTDGHSYFY